MTITRKEYENLDINKMSKDEKLRYSNPCVTDDPNILRVGEVFDSDLDAWRSAEWYDF